MMPIDVARIESPHRMMWARTTGSGSHQKASSTSPDAPSTPTFNLRRSALLMRARFQSRWMLPLRRYSRLNCSEP